MILSFIVNGKPLSQNAVYRRRKGFGMYMTKEGKAWKKRVAEAAGEAIAKAESGWVGLLTVPKWPTDSEYAVKVTCHHADKRGDHDGPLKMILDALQGTVYDNDRRVVESTIRREIDRENPRTEIVVEVLL